MHFNSDATPVQTPSKNDVERYLRRRSATGRYFVFFRDYLEVMSRDAALVLQCLINLVANVGDGDGWALCTMEFLRTQLKLERDAQLRVLNELKRLGFLEIAHRGMPARRYVRPDILAVERAIDLAEGQDTAIPVSSQQDTVVPVDSIRESPYSAYGESRTTPNTSKTTQVKTHKQSAAAAAAPTDRAAEVAVPKKAEPPSKPSKAAVQVTSKATELDRKRACRLHDMLVKHRKLFSTPCMPRWADEFRRLREALGDAGQDRVDPLLDWYEQHLPDQYTPQAYSARAFRDKFAGLEAAAQRCKCRRSDSKATAPPPELDRAGQRIVAELKQLHWPRGSASQVPAAVAESLAAYRGLLARLRAAELPRHLDSLRRHLLNTMQVPEEFVPDHLERECRQYARWDDWSGVVKPFAPDSRRFTQAMREAADEWCGEPERWDELLAAVGVVQ